MKKRKIVETPNHEWYKAKLSPMAAGIFTESFYPEAKQRTGTQYVFFATVPITPTKSKVIVSSRMEDSGFRILTPELASTFLIPSSKATKAEMFELNALSVSLDKNM